MLLTSSVAVAAQPLLLPRRRARVGDGESTISQTIEQYVESVGESLRELVEDVLGHARHLRSLALAHIRRLDRTTDTTRRSLTPMVPGAHQSPHTVSTHTVPMSRFIG